MANKTDITAGQILTKTISGNGEFLSMGFTIISGAKADADYTLLATEYATVGMKFAWTGFTAPRNVIVPTVSGALFYVWNITGQTCTVKTAAGAGIAVANNTAALLFCDGTRVCRITDDNDPTV